MRARFPKVWCASCSSMQFAGECPHGRTVVPFGYGLVSQHALYVTWADLAGQRQPKESQQHDEAFSLKADG